MASKVPKTALVLGLGTTGLSCARYLSAHGHSVRVADSRKSPPMLEPLRAEFPDMPVHTGPWTADVFEDAELLVVSPGLSLREPMIAAALAAGATAVGDIELFARATTSPVIAITGANGKSTVTTLVGEMCRAARLNVAVGGNIGTPALDLLRQPEPDVYVLELSSFQLETTYSLNARSATVLNITPDHMDRYVSLEEYAAAKERIFRGDGVLVLNRDDSMVMAMARADRRMLYFGLSAPRDDRDYGLVRKDNNEWLAHGARLLMPVSQVRLAGRHNLANALAAAALAGVIGVPFDAMKQVLGSFRGLRHRTEVVGERNGVLWINDSKGTNVGATVAALNGMDRPVLLIAGGDGKGADFSQMRDAVRSRVRTLILIGRDAPLLERALGDIVPVTRAVDMSEAVQRAASMARSGDAVLLSPACASFDMFRNYEHRGDVFRDAVAGIVA
ncbi:MAG: UDP-N-acetylmuramoyl-L-alanine--D-glutamate ligase [Gammaproteobacteria bacterium]|nr:UDP-N-acetylmuramoyl-L-alanine--D-glutamate ligase [Gammaproteobacteria bacterium]